MVDIAQVPHTSKMILHKLEDALSKLASELKKPESTSISISTNEIYQTVSQYFKEIGDAEFQPELLTANDSPRSEVYNKNLLSVHNDIKRFYEDLRNLTDLQVKSFNFAQVLTQDILNRANALASTVLDLNILNNFDRGDVIIASDDFNTLEFVDSSISLGAESTELLPGGGGLSLARDSSVDVIDNQTEIDVIPLSPAGSGNTVETSPTPGNIGRFYEGLYYNFIGAARPEGGYFNIKYLLEPKVQEGVVSETVTVNNKVQSEVDSGPEKGEVVDLGATAEDKKRARRRMIDKDPSSFWECEFLYRIEGSLIPELAQDNESKPRTKSGLFSFVSRALDIAKKPSNNEADAVTIDINQAEKFAKQYDFPGRDLIVEIVLTLSEIRTINMVNINPVLFGADAFPEIVDISTASNADGEFKTVPGWDSIKFAKKLTGEANELLTDSQIEATLAPSRTSFKGQGVFTFPATEAKKIKIKIKVDSPVPSPYERTYILLTNNLKTTTTTTTTTKKGSLRF